MTYFNDANTMIGILGVGTLIAELIGVVAYKKHKNTFCSFMFGMTVLLAFELAFVVIGCGGGIVIMGFPIMKVYTSYCACKNSQQ